MISTQETRKGNSNKPKNKDEMGLEHYFKEGNNNNSNSSRKQKEKDTGSLPRKETTAMLSRHQTTGTTHTVKERTSGNRHVIRMKTDVIDFTQKEETCASVSSKDISHKKEHVGKHKPKEKETGGKKKPKRNATKYERYFTVYSS